MTPATLRRILVPAGFAAVAILPRFYDFALQGLAGRAVAAALLGLSLVLLTGMVGQVSFCQYSFAALGAFTVGSLVRGHGVNFWVAALLGVAFAGVGGVLVGIPALRLRGLLLAVLTVMVALFFDVSLLAPGTWDGFTGGTAGWPLVPFPSLFGHLMDSYTFYLFALAVFAAAAGLVWNLRNGKTGRVLRAVRDSEVASSTLGLNVSGWKLAAFGVSAALAGLAGALQAVAVGSVAGGSQSGYSFQYSVALVATVTVFGASSIFSAAAAGFFIVFAPQLLDMIPKLSHDWWPLILGAILIVQLVTSPDGVVVKTQRDVRHLLHRISTRRQTVAAPAHSEAA
jgi:branched-chain amino acid transport system permease protein